ncbi:MAG: glycosyltransferase [Lapillicoccus sp.]
MSSVLLVLVLLAAGVAGQLLLTDRRRVPHQSPRPAPFPDGAGTVSVIVPARNEAGTLPLLLRSLRSLTASPLEVLVVDDSSADGTAEIASSAGATVVRAGEPPSGWTGKAWACHRGVATARGSVLLFLDADTVLEPDALAGLLTLHRQQGGLVSVQPFHETIRAYEQLSAYFNVMSLLASGAFSRRRPRHPLAFGPTLITSRTDYERAGGHTAVRAEILDDARLASAYAGQGLPVHCVLGGPALRMRMYPGGPRQMIEGWTKNIASGAGAADRWSALGAGVWLASHWAVTVGAVLALLSLLLAPAGVQVPMTVGHPTIWAAAWVGVSLQLRAMLDTVGAFRWWTWALFPAALLAFTVLFVRSVLLTRVRHEVAWRGRAVPIGRSSHHSEA